jgi:hypothetical protein
VRPRRYWAVMSITATTIAAISPANAPVRYWPMVEASEPATTGAISAAESAGGSGLPSMSMRGRSRQPHHPACTNPPAPTAAAILAAGQPGRGVAMTVSLLIGGAGFADAATGGKFLSGTANHETSTASLSDTRDTRWRCPPRPGKPRSRSTGRSWSRT